MLEGLAAKILQNYIGKYVNVNVDKLSVGLLTGVVELENVPLKPEAFNDHDLPFELKLGYVEKIKLNISLNSLRYAPLLLTADNLFIIIGPKRISKKTNERGEDSSDEIKLKSMEEYKQKLQLEKLDRLLNLENRWFKKCEFLGKIRDRSSNKIYYWLILIILNILGVAAAGGVTSEEQTSYFSVLGTLAYLLKNIHVNLNHIHVRYEDDDFTIGAYIASICIKNSSDETAVSTTQATEAKNLTKKSCEINSFSIYTDVKILYTPEITKEIVLEQMDFTKYTSQSTTLKYVIQPTSLTAQITRDMSLQPLRKRNRPRLRVTSTLREFHLHIDDEQIKYVSNIIRHININSNRNIPMRPKDLSYG